MATPSDPFPAPPGGWLGFSRAAGHAVQEVLVRYPTTSDRGRTTERGQGGDMTLAIDQAAEDAVFAELESIGLPLTAVSEERGHVAVHGGGPLHVILDPMDGSLNSKRHLGPFSLSIAVAHGQTMGDVELGWVYDFAAGEEWHAVRGQGAFADGKRLPALDSQARLEFLGIEGAHPRRLAAAAGAMEHCSAARVRAHGSMAVSLCFVAHARLDGMLSLGATRSVDVAAGQLIVREAGGAVRLPDAQADPLEASLGLDMRSRVFGAAGEVVMDELLGLDWG